MIKAFILAFLLAAAHCAPTDSNDEIISQAENIKETAEAGFNQSLDLVDDAQEKVELALKQLAAQLAAQVKEGTLTKAAADQQLLSATVGNAEQLTKLRMLINHRGQPQVAQITALLDTIDSDEDAVVKIGEVVKEAKQDRAQLVQALAGIVEKANKLSAAPKTSGQAQSSGGIGGFFGRLFKPLTGLFQWGKSGQESQAQGSGVGVSQGLNVGGKYGVSESVKVGAGLDSNGARVGKAVNVGLLGQKLGVNEEVKVGLNGLSAGQDIDGKVLGQSIKANHGVSLGKGGLGLNQGLSLGGKYGISESINLSGGVDENGAKIGKDVSFGLLGSSISVSEKAGAGLDGAGASQDVKLNILGNSIELNNQAGAGLGGILAGTGLKTNIAGQQTKGRLGLGFGK
ncbi:hypothetical protein HDE_04530 [Halotydeus destructor]|nr:hypothetical protein HDE_04530 [Halotydeus destructor]